MSVNTQYAPKNLQEKEKVNMLFVLSTDKTRKILRVILEEGSLYLNEIQNKVGGSKTTTVQILRSLERRDMIQSEWKMIEGTKGNPPRAVRAFKLKENKVELIGYYKPLIEISKDVMFITNS